MVSLTNVLFCASVATAMVLEPRTPAQILASLRTIDSDTNALTTSTKNWDGSINGAVTIQNQEQGLEDDIDSATTLAKKEPQASSADSQRIINYVTNTLEPDISASITQIIKRKADFVAIGLQSTVEDDCTALKTKADALANALIKAASNDQKSAGQAAKAAIDADLQRCIDAFA